MATGNNPLEEKQLNESLDDVIELLQNEIERLQTSLETYRLSRHPQRQDIVRWHVQALDKRQDTLDELKDLMIAARQEAVH